MATVFLFVDLKHGSLTRGPHAAYPVVLRGPGATFVNYVYSIKSTQFRRLGIPVIVIFTRAARSPSHNDFCGTFPIKVGHP